MIQQRKKKKKKKKRFTDVCDCNLEKLFSPYGIKINNVILSNFDDIMNAS